MEFILINSDGHEVGPLKEKEYIDIDCGKDNTFEIRITKKYYKEMGISDGWRIGVVGKEYGGIIKKIIVNTETDSVSLQGPTWRGMLTKKIIEPPNGEDYKIVNGDANDVIRNIVCTEFDGLFKCFGESNILINNFKFDRYVSHLDGIEKMLLSKNSKLQISYNSGEPNGTSFVLLHAVKITDYSKEIEYSPDGTLSFLSFTFEEDNGGINHLICLGKGDLKERQVIHLYEQEDGSIGDVKHFNGLDERVATYDYPNASDENDLVEKGIERMRELMSYKKMDMDLHNATLAGLRGVEDSISIGDIVGGKDHDTGFYLKKQITEKIVTVKNDQEIIEYKVGGNASKV